MTVPNRFPTITSPYRLAIIGEAPGEQESKVGEPFVGISGRFLAALLSRAGISREACFLGNVCQHQPPDNHIYAFSWSGDEIQSSLATLTDDLTKFNPHCCLLLGNTALKAALDPDNDHPLTPKRFKYPVSNWRGTLFRGFDGAFNELKCISSYHPAYVLRDYSTAPMLQFDIKRAVVESRNSELRLPQREISTSLSCTSILERISAIRVAKQPIALDIEGGIDTMSCISFAEGPGTAFIVPFHLRDGSQPFPAHDMTRIWRAVAALLEDPEVPKILQNSLYDRFVLQYAYRIVVRNVVDDTMLKHWELYSELEKSLGVQASIYTYEPFYKGERKSQDDSTFFAYCCKDSAVTYECCNKQTEFFHQQRLAFRLSPEQHAARFAHYQQNIQLLNPLLFMEMRGIRYDIEGAAKRRATLLNEYYCESAKLNAMTGYGFSFRAKHEIFNRARELMAFKRVNIAPNDWNAIATNAKKSHSNEAADLYDAVIEPNPTLATIGRIESLCETSLNVESPKQFTSFLYETLGLPKQYKKNSEGEMVLTADYEALLKLAKILTRDGQEANLAIVKAAIEIRSLGTRSQMLSISADHDGRIRCGYNLVGSETGRVTCYTSPTGSGYNLQTIPKYDRDLFLADDGKWLFQCDLSGADGWTVAAYCAMLGDSTMLDDYRFGLKPANILTLMLRGVAVDFADRSALKAASKTVTGDDWDYFAMKRVQHGSSYCEGGPTISNNIFKDSEGRFYLEPRECVKLKDQFFFHRYPGIRRWHDWVGRRLRERPILVAASGQVRQFFGRADDILTEAVAFEPQANTTYATNLAMHRLWTDPENHTPTHSLIIEPLHQVHDALLGQFDKDKAQWAAVKIKSYFANPLIIAGQHITIPFEGGYGRSWGELKEGKI